MSRDPSGIYSYPDGTRGTPGATIFSARYNTFLDDLAVTLNTKLPLNMGGTNADDAAEARTNLQAEVRGMQVTDYDTHIFESGSFWSAPGAAGAPDALGKYVGYAVVYGADQNNIFLSVRNVLSTGQPPGENIRQKKDGVWQNSGVWLINGAQNFVELAGDTMTGILTIKPPTSHAVLTLDRTDVSAINLIIGSVGGSARWQMRPGDSGAAADFSIWRCNDAGAVVDAPLGISRATGFVSGTGKPVNVRAFTTGSGTYTPTAGTVRIRYRMVGGGGGGGGGGATPGAGGAGGNTVLGSLNVSGANGSTGGGISLGHQIGFPGGSGNFPNWPGGTGGIAATSPFGGAGIAVAFNNPGQAAVAFTGSGGGGGGSDGVNPPGSGGGAAGWAEGWIQPVSAMAYAVGTGGAGGAAGTGGKAGGNGGSGLLFIEEYFL